MRRLASCIFTLVLAALLVPTWGSNSKPVAHAASDTPAALDRTVLSDTPVDAAARALELTRPKLNTLIIALGKQVGPPWGKHQKEAAAAALAALGS